MPISVFFGGDLMQAEGGAIVKHFADMAFMGFFEVVANLNTILKKPEILQG